VPVQRISTSEVEALLRDPSYIELERRIVSAVGQQLLPEYIGFFLPLVTKDLNEADISIAEATWLLALPLTETSAFGVALIRGEGAVPDEQEWDPHEGDQQRSRDKGEPVGLSPGFGLLALVYMSFISSGREEELLSLLKQRRVPRAKQFLARLKTYHQSACAR
jgi:hypothetical protein